MHRSAFIPLLSMLMFMGCRAESFMEPGVVEPDWYCRASLYGWATGLDGEVSIIPRSAPVDVGFDDILESLDMAIMGALEIGRGRWGVAADVFFAELSTANTIRSLDYEVALDQFIGNFVLVRNVVDDWDMRCDFYVGARFVSLDTEMDLFRNGVLRTRTFSGSASESWADPIFGVRMNRDLPCDFFFRCLGDVGGFGVGSDLTWQAMAGLGYAFDEHAAVMLGYRAMSADYENNSFQYDVTSHGFLIQLEYQF